jgi:hypothetical protein
LYYIPICWYYYVYQQVNFICLVFDYYDWPIGQNLSVWLNPLIPQHCYIFMLTYALCMCEYQFFCCFDYYCCCCYYYYYLYLPYHTVVVVIIIIIIIIYSHDIIKAFFTL